MNIDTKAYVVGLLESYQKRSKQIDLLHYELSHPARISEEEMIGAMSLAHGEGGPHPTGHISDKTLYIALNYQENIDKINAGTVADIVDRLVELEAEQNRLLHYVSLLESKEAEIIQLFYFRKQPLEQIAAHVGIALRTAYKIKDRAINSLVDMYEFSGVIT